MFALLGPIQAHLSEYRKDLLKMQPLLRSDNVSHPIKMKPLMTIDSSGKVSSSIDRCSIAFLEHTGRQFFPTFIGDRYNPRPLTLDQDASFFQILNQGSEIV